MTTTDDVLSTCQTAGITEESDDQKTTMGSDGFRFVRVQICDEAGRRISESFTKSVGEETHRGGEFISVQ